MKMFIPPLNCKLRLLEDWEFDLMCEQRNRTLWDLKTDLPPMSSIYQSARVGLFHPVKLVRGDELIIRRIFIRQGYEGYNSVTMSGRVQHLGVIRSVRFWVLLDDFNTMEAEVIE